MRPWSWHGSSLRADTALDDLSHAYHRSGHLLLVGVTTAPLSVRGEEVFGNSQVGGNACIVSVSKLDSESVQLRLRLLKLALHQTGHTFGLAHSDDPQSVMFDAKDVAALDATRSSYSEEELATLMRKPPLEGQLERELREAG